MILLWEIDLYNPSLYMYIYKPRWCLHHNFQKCFWKIPFFTAPLKHLPAASTPKGCHTIRINANQRGTIGRKFRRGATTSVCDVSAAGCFWCFSVSLTPPGNSTIQSRTILKKKTACSLCKRNSRHTHLFTHKKNGFVFTTQHRWNENGLQVASLYACDHFKKDLHECCFPFQ